MWDFVLCCFVLPSWKKSDTRNATLDHHSSRKSYKLTQTNNSKQILPGHITAAICNTILSFSFTYTQSPQMNILAQVQHLLGEGVPIKLQEVGGGIFPLLILFLILQNVVWLTSFWKRKHTNLTKKKLTKKKTKKLL